MTKKILILCIWAICLPILAQEPCPRVIPALQQWKGGKGTLTLPPEGNIVVNPASKTQLWPTATILADDLKELMGWNYTIKTGEPQENDIYLSLDKPDKQLGDEGYVMHTDRHTGIHAPPPKVCSGVRAPSCRSPAAGRESFRKEQPATTRLSPTGDSCWTWPANSSRWTI